MKTLFARIVVAGAVLTSLGACGDGGQEPVQKEPPITIHAVTDLKALVLPLDAYLPTRDQATILLNAENKLKLDCLRNFGFDLSVPRAQSKPVAPNERRYGITNEADAAAYGYRLPPQYVVERQKGPEISDAAASILSGKGQNSYEGQAVPEGGCAGEARRKLADGQAASADADLAQSLKAQALDRSRNDSRTVEAVSKWKACMAEVGYDYSDPFDANDDAQFASGETASAAEIATASADARCKKGTHLVDVWSAVDAAYQSRAIERHSEALAAAKQLLEAKLRNAATVVGV